MGRRTFGISVSQINRYMASYRAQKVRQENIKIVNKQKGVVTKLKPIYEIIDFDFNKESRISHIEFAEKTRYRTIERYITVDGKRYPVYGSFKDKSKKIKKIIKMTNEKLENLNNDSDDLIAEFSSEIVSRLNNEDYYPSWFLVNLLDDEMKYVIDCNNKKYDELIENEKKKITIFNDIITKAEQTKVQYLKERKEWLSDKIKLEKKITKYSGEKNTFVSILTFGLISFLYSEKHVASLKKELDSIICNIEVLTKKCESSDKDINDTKVKKEKCEEKISSLIEGKKKSENDTWMDYQKKKTIIEPLPMTIDESVRKDFIPLKTLCGMTYEKIVGCYVIHNIENDKYYVGQSKDVLRRVCKQHFDGTKVKNIIFAKDYFESKLENKDDLFEVKIIRLNTKDELDQKERNLIEEYDSFNNGYNGTGGNL